MKKILPVLLFASLAGTSPAAATSVFGFSYFGRDVNTADARIEGRGGVGIAYTDSMNAAVLHAAQLADLRRVTIGLTGRFRSTTAEDDLGSVRRLGMSTPVVRMGLPLPGGGGLGFGFTAARATQWTLDRPWLPAVDPGDGTVYREIIEREGTLFDVPVQVGYRLFDRVAVGAGVHFRGGAIRIRYELGEYDPLRREISRRLQSDIRDDTYFGWAPELSLAVHDLGPVSLGGYWIFDYEADVDARQSTLRDPDDQPVTRKDQMPQRAGLGARVALPARFSLGADFTWEEWSAYEGRTFTYNADGAFDPGGVALDMKDERTWRFGIEREAVRVGLRYTTPLRLGFYMRDWHYQVLGNDLQEWGFTLGSGLALRGGLSRIDFAAGYSETGDRADNGIVEKLWTIVVSVSGGETWY